jgi:hypothetical protein
MMAILQILFDQYHIWDIFGLWMKSKVFFVEKTSEWEKLCRRDLSTVPKRPKIPQIPQSLFSRFGQFAQKFEMSLKKGFIWRL